jgi:microcystin-dependent protein
MVPFTLGSIAFYTAPSDPPGGLWLIADGRAISRAFYAEYFALVGTTYGAGDGSTTFNIPNIEKRIVGNGAVSAIILVQYPSREGAVYH